MSLLSSNKFITRSRKKAIKYPKQWRAYVRGAVWSFVALFSFVVLYFSVQEWSWFNFVLGVAVTISGVVFGVFLQELLSFLVVPDKDVLFPLRRNALFSEFYGALRQFSDKIKHDEGNLLDDEETEIWVLLSSPLLVDFDETDKVTENPHYRTKFEKELHHIFSASQDFTRHLVCLNMEASRQFGVSPWERFLKVFSGYIVSASKEFSESEILPSSSEEVKFYSKVDAFRRRMRIRVHDFCKNTYVKPHLRFATQVDLQWQAIVIKAPQIRFYKAVVGFYGEDFFRKYSRLGLMSQIRTEAILNPDNQGFVSDEPDIVDWVIDGLVRPYFQETPVALSQAKHHSCGVHETISEILPNREGTSQIRTLVDDMSRFTSINLKYEHGPAKLLRKIEYPVYGSADNGAPKTRKLTYCQYLFHPLVAESSTWSSFNLRLSGGHSVLDMCTGIGVQALAAIDRGATFVQTVEVDPIALLCAADNFRVHGEREGLTIKCSLGDGFTIRPFSEFETKFKESIQDRQWGETLTQCRKNELNDLLEMNRNWIEDHYAEDIEKEAFDLVVLEPPFVEFSHTELCPSHDSLFDPHFKILRLLLRDSIRYLKHADEATDPWLRPYVFQSFSSLESTEELESFLESEKLYTIFRKHCVERNNVHWYAYHLLPNPSLCGFQVSGDAAKEVTIGEINLPDAATPG